ncbi:MAG: ATP-binding cassette domain-containing protein [Defluviitaleaceae bacterium]|nr:ATP-binding cassette domain-containing protein [Defluviitaleaceae bacterium]
MKTIKITGARIHNLKNIDIEIPKDKLTVITGVSGSGKSSFAFDTLYEEGKRRYLMFSNTQFMVDNVPTFDSITGLSPTVAVEQRITRQSNPRSTVGTRTKISAMMAVLFAAYGSRAPEYDYGDSLIMEMFQKNSPKGMCVRCLGSGRIHQVNEDIFFGDKTRTLFDFFTQAIDEKNKESRSYGYHTQNFVDYCAAVGLSHTQTIDSLNEAEFDNFRYGGRGTRYFNGMFPWIIHLYKWSIGRKRDNWITNSNCVYETPCPKCNGSGLGEQANNTKVGGKTITEFENMYIRDLCDFLKSIKPQATKLIGEIITKLECMIDVGLHHLALSRPLPTLSGGEIQRLFLVSYIIAEMDSIIFIFDEPTIGLHEVEKQKLISIIKSLIQRGNTVVAVEHDIGFMQAADYIIDLGPNAGEYGGEKIFQGKYDDFVKVKNSATAPYLSGERALPVKTHYKKAGDFLRLENCQIHNLRNLSVQIPLGLLVGVAGVSGSGKSSLISDTLVPKLKEVLKTVTHEDEEAETILLPQVKIIGYEKIKKCLIIDQKPIGRSRTSCPATYTGIFDRVRKMFADSPSAAQLGFGAGMFSVNAEGKCRKCMGNGEIHYHVGLGNFIHIECEECGGTGFLPDVMNVVVDGKNIRDILGMSITAAVDFFKEKNAASYRMLKTLDRVGLGYMKLGQQTPTISGGEAQRLKLAKELGKSNKTSGFLYILDEPTTGLSFSDSEKLIRLMQELVDNGNSVIVTEHDPIVLANCDHIIEMGPGGGSDGGYILATGTPAELKENKKSIIGRYLP